MAKDTFYFSHDYNARTDKKTRALIKNHGAAGYGVYWILVEMLHEEEDSELELDEIQYDLLSDETKIEIDQLKPIIEDCINKYKLFVLEDNILRSNRVDRNKEKRTELKEKRREAGKKGAKERWGNSKPIANANSKIANDGKGKESKGNKRKEIKENKEEEYTPEQLASFNKFCDWQKEHAPRVLKMDQPLTIAEYLRLCIDFKQNFGLVKDTLVNMHNYKKLTTKVSANLTLRNWIKNEYKKGYNEGDDGNEGLSPATIKLLGNE